MNCDIVIDVELVETEDPPAKYFVATSGSQRAEFQWHNVMDISRVVEDVLDRKIIKGFGMWVCYFAIREWRPNDCACPPIERYYRNNQSEEESERTNLRSFLVCYGAKVQSIPDTILRKRILAICEPYVNDHPF